MDNQTVYFSKVKESAKIPSKRVEDAGFDIYACFEEDNFIIQQHSNGLVPTGIASAVSSDYFFLLEERGSTGVKNLKRSAGIIDSGYRNEWFACLYNGNDKPLIITKETNEDTLKNLEEDFVIYPYGKAICQAILLPVQKVNVNEILYEDLKQMKSERGMGSLGSSNK